MAATRSEKRRAMVIALLAITLLGSLALNVIIARWWKAEFARENEVRLDPAGLRVYQRERDARDAGDAAKPSERRPLIAIFGDSRALMWGTPSIVGYEVRNVGVGYQTTAQLLLRFEADVARWSPSVIVLEGGVNDLKAVALFPERRGEIVADCKRNLASLIARSRATGATVIVTSIFAIGDVPFYRASLWSDQVAPAVVEVNAYLQSLAGERVAWLDADPVLDDTRGKVKPDFQFDFLHVNPSGYLALDEKLVQLLSNLPLLHQ